MITKDPSLTKILNLIQAIEKANAHEATEPKYHLTIAADNQSGAIIYKTNDKEIGTVGWFSNLVEAIELAEEELQRAQQWAAQQ